MFTKADPQQARLKISAYGPTGSGKTFTALLMAEGLAAYRDKRIAYIDTERGTDFYGQEVPQRQLHPDAFDFDAIYTRSLAECMKAIEDIDTDEHGIVIVDSITHLWQAAIDAYGGSTTKVGSIPFHAWGKIKKPYKRIIDLLMDSPCDVFILGRQKNIWGEDAETGELRQKGVGMRAEGETEYEPHICWRHETERDIKDTTRSIYRIYVEKDRTGVLAGRTIEMPSFQTIEPLLPLLGEKQATRQDPEEREEADGELLKEQDEKRAKKADRSRALAAEFQGKLAFAGTMAELATVGDEIKKAKRKLTTEDIATLREYYEHYRTEMAKKETPGI